MLHVDEKIILPNMKYKINIKTNEITRLSGKPVSKKIKVGKYRVKIDLHGYVKVVKLDWLAMIAAYRFNIPIVKGLDRKCIFDIEFRKSGFALSSTNNNIYNSYVVNWERNILIYCFLLYTSTLLLSTNDIIRYTVLK